MLGFEVEGGAPAGSEKGRRLGCPISLDAGAFQRPAVHAPLGARSIHSQQIGPMRNLEFVSAAISLVDQS
jgi:hypothetical protein